MLNINKVKHVSSDELRAMLSLYRPRGLFLCREGKWWIAIIQQMIHGQRSSAGNGALRWLRGD